MIEGCVSESCLCGRKGWMKRWIQLWSSLQETALQSAAKPAKQHACMWCSSCWASRLPTNVRVWRVKVCVWEREREKEIEVWCRPLWWGAGALPPPLCLPACCAAASWMYSRDAAFSAYLTLSLAHALRALFLSLTHSLTRCARWLPPLPRPPPLSCHHPPTSQITFMCRAAAL